MDEEPEKKPKSRGLKKNNQRLRRPDNKDLSDGELANSDLYEDDDDRERLENMPELQREKILSERFEKRKQEERKRKLQNEQGQESEHKTDKKKAALSELQKKRQDRAEKAHTQRKKRRGSDEDSDEEEEAEDTENSESAEDSEYEEEPQTKKRKESEKESKSIPVSRPEREGEIKRGDLESIRISRKLIEQLISHKFFEKVVTGCFVRASDTSAKTNAVSNYVIAEITGVKDYPDKKYIIETKETTKYLILKHAKREIVYKMSHISNSEFVESEFNKWILKLEKYSLKLPSLSRIKQKYQELKNAINYRYSDEEINNMVLERLEEKRRKGEMFTINEIELLENKLNDIEFRLHHNPGDIEARREKEKLMAEIAKHKKMHASAKKESTQDTIDQINEKNRRLQAEKDMKLAAYKNKLQKQAESFNPFNRKDCRPTNMWDSELKLTKTFSNKASEKTAAELEAEALEKKTRKEINDEIKKEFLSMHKVTLAIDELVNQLDENEVF
eukprot:CAMPEP_0176451292 /NCGR_PEP_ID=MMETSP0127-20121128/27738_1 /TAXON_ID=938130 /ORGANISM="Platyophrya macrostoma, Strain WH" /LENGTH=503 /DNA_ID=CAMNT_0017839297 /DNA_START=107 /DNA_END=1618 /DNA_ORIENTATION=+